MDEKMRKFIPLFVLVGVALVAAAIYIIVYSRWDADQRSIGGASELLVGSMARSYYRPVIHSQLVRQ